MDVTARQSLALEPSKRSPPTTKDYEFLHEAVKRFAQAETDETERRASAVDDLRFRNGDQWTEATRAERTIAKRPCLTINKLPTFIHQVVNDQRQNRPAINVSPVGDKSDPETAKMLKGLIRQIERASRADIAYDTGFESAVTIGWGYWRIITDYENDASFDQIIKVERILNPFTVYIDPDCSDPCAFGAQWAFVTREMTREEFRQEWPKASLVSWTEGSMGDEFKSWASDTHVRIAEYFYTEYTKRTLLLLDDGRSGYEDELDIAGAAVLKEREVQVPRIMWCKITAHEVLERREWPGKYLPIVRVIGDEVEIEGKLNYLGLVRPAKDPQRMYNYWVTAETENVALMPKAPWIIEEGQLEGHEDEWRLANVKSMSYLAYKGTSISGKPAPAPQRQQFAGPPTGVVQAKIAAAQDIQGVTGIRFDATLQERMHDESGKALVELKRIGELGQYHYIDNYARSLRYTGMIYIDLIPRIYDTRRVITILREDGTDERVTVDPGSAQSFQRLDDGMGQVQRLYNPTVGDFDVAVTIGPSYATKRAESSEAMLNFLKVMPNSAPLIGDLIAKNQDWPGADEIATRLASMLPPAVMNKQLDQLPPEARGMVASLMQQMQQMKQEHDQAVAMLGNKEADRDIERQKLEIDKNTAILNYQAQIAKVKEDYETKMAKLMADSGADAQQAIDQARDEAAMEQQTKMVKIAADFEASMRKIQADLAATQMKNEAEQQKLREQMQFDSDEGDRQRAFDGKQASADRSFQGEEADADRQMEASEGSKERRAKASEGNAKQSAKEVVAKLQARVKQLEGAKPKKITIKSSSGRTYTAEVE